MTPRTDRRAEAAAPTARVLDMTTYRLRSRPVVRQRHRRATVDWDAVLVFAWCAAGVLLGLGLAAVFDRIVAALGAAWWLGW